jgi:hypothetical protein
MPAPKMPILETRTGDLTRFADAKVSSQDFQVNPEDDPFLSDSGSIDVNAAIEFKRPAEMRNSELPRCFREGMATPR